MQMNAPDKIYVPLTINLLTKRQVLRLDATDVKPISFANENIAYIRKDALLEWARGMIEDTPGSEYQKGQNKAFEQLITHIESL